MVCGTFRGITSRHYQPRVTRSVARRSAQHGTPRHRCHARLLRVWLGGQHAQARVPPYINAATLTYTLSNTIHSIALTTGSIYVDLPTAFHGPDETSLLTDDGDH